LGFVLALKQQNLDTLEKLFWEVSDPKHEKYQHFLTVEELDKMTGTSAEDVQKVREWLESVMPKEDHPKIEMRGDSVLVTGLQASTIEKLFATKLYIYTHKNGHTIVRAFGEYSIPQALEEIVEFTEGITDFPMHRSSSIRKPTAASNVMIVPQSLASLYSFEDTKVSSSAKQMPAEFQDDSSFSPTDLETFFKQTALPDQKVTTKVGPFNDQYPDVEASLDTQYITAVGLGVDNWYWTSEGWMYTFATNLVNNKGGVPNVVSMSWGWSEQQQCGVNGIVEQECKTLGVDDVQYVDRVNTEFQKLGLMGVSLFASSGDSGANGRTDEMCTDKTLHATFPAASAYLTAVGATQLTSTAQTDLKNPPPVCSSYKCASKGTEVAVSFTQAGFTSGGGFSKYIKQPTYQTAAVSKYLKSGVELPPSTYYNAQGRGYPDVSAMGSNFLVYIEQEGGWMGVGGTSASSPTWGGVAGRLNDISIAKTGKPLGFMNQLLYQMQAEHPAAFTDVLKGDNKCTESGCASTCKGFEATKGWDPVTGLGTPVYSEIEQYVTKVFEQRAQKEAIVV